MTQQDILCFLKKHKGCWFNNKVLSEWLGISKMSCLANINKLARFHLINKTVRVVMMSNGRNKTFFVSYRGLVE